MNIIRRRKLVGWIVRHRWVFPALIISLILHLSFLAANPGKVFNMPGKYGADISTFGSRDAALYAKMADQMLTKHIYGYNDDEPNARITPGQPVYLAASFMLADVAHVSRLKTVQVFNLMMSVGTVFIVFYLSIMLGGTNSVALLASLLYATYFSPLHFFRTTLTETPAIFLAYLSLYLYIKTINVKNLRPHFLFSICFCVAVLFRPTPAPLIVLAAMPVLFRHSGRDCLRIFTMWALGAALIFGPWFLRNYLVFHELMFTSHGGNPLLAGANPFFADQYPTMLREARESGLGQGGFAFARILAGFNEHPDLWLAWFTAGKAYWLFRVPAAWLGYLPNFASFNFFVYGAQYFILIFSAIFSVMYGVGARKYLKVTILGYVVLSLFFLPNSRYGFFAIPGMIVMAALGTNQALLYCKGIFTIVKIRTMEVISPRKKSGIAKDSVVADLAGD